MGRAELDAIDRGWWRTDRRFAICANPMINR
jgi:hypothetical protein